MSSKDSIIELILMIIGLPIVFCIMLVGMLCVVVLVVICAPFDREYALELFKEGYRYFIRDAFK